MSTVPSHQTATPSAVPAPGAFGVTQRITLLCATPGATIHYSIDGSIPDRSSPTFDAYELPVLDAINDGDRGISTTYTLKAFAVSDQLAPSDVATFTYVVERRDKDAYLTTEVRPGIHMIRDFDDTKMYLVIGSARALLIDAGLGTGNLRALVERMIGLLVDQGEQVLVPSLRPTDAWQVVVGDRLSDPNWAAINVAKGSCLSAPPEKIATLSNLQLKEAQLEPSFMPHHDTYTVVVGAAAGAFAITPTTTSGRHQSLTINGATHRSGATHWVQLGQGEPHVTIAVSSPDGTVCHTYTLAVSRMAA